MGRIVLLDEQTANQIAAGEVVEGPASVVKEMVENAVDAGATQVQVEIRNGGVKMIRVTDNGSGMERDDVEMAFERHATSKIRQIGDLDSIRSMGFRGEALASIASVSRLEMLTRTAEDEIGVKVVIDGGHIQSVEDAGCPVGTTFLVRDLFHNTPARYKFLKKDTTEAARVEDVLERLALAHPDVSIQFRSNGETLMHTPGNGELASTIYSLYGKETANALLPLNLDREGIRVTGFIGRPAIARGNRARQTVLMNQRFIQNRSITAALDEAYKTLLMTRQFPFAVIVLEVPPMRVDVNVHPAKLEVRFSEEGIIFSAVHGAVRNALMAGALAGDLAPVETFGGKVQETGVRETTALLPVSEQQRFVAAPSGMPDQAGIRIGSEVAGTRRDAPAVTGHEERPQVAIQNQVSVEMQHVPMIADQAPIVREQVPASETPVPAALEQVPVNGSPAIAAPQIVLSSESPVPAALEQITAIQMTVPAVLEQVPVESPKAPEGQTYSRDAAPGTVRHPVFLEMRIVGQVFDSFIVLQQGDEMLLLDQHAAHERIRFEDLKWSLESGQAPSQPLLQPVRLELSAMEYGQAVQSMEELHKLGFDLETFGRNTILVRAIPSTFDGGLTETELASILTDWPAESARRQGGISEEILHRISCKGAIKANRQMGNMEIKALLERLSGLENPYSCVHGRPILLRFPRRELEKRFKRIV